MRRISWQYPAIAYHSPCPASGTPPQTNQPQHAMSWCQGGDELPGKKAGRTISGRDRQRYHRSRQTATTTRRKRTGAVSRCVPSIHSAMSTSASSRRSCPATTRSTVSAIGMSASVWPIRRSFAPVARTCASAGESHEAAPWVALVIKTNDHSLLGASATKLRRRDCVQLGSYETGRPESAPKKPGHIWLTARWRKATPTQTTSRG